MELEIAVRRHVNQTAGNRYSIPPQYGLIVDQRHPQLCCLRVIKQTATIVVGDLIQHDLLRLGNSDVRRIHPGFGHHHRGGHAHLGNADCVQHLRLSQVCGRHTRQLEGFPVGKRQQGRPITVGGDQHVGCRN